RSVTAEGEVNALSSDSCTVIVWVPSVIVPLNTVIEHSPSPVIMSAAAPLAVAVRAAGLSDAADSRLFLRSRACVLIGAPGGALGRGGPGAAPPRGVVVSVARSRAGRSTAPHRGAQPITSTADDEARGVAGRRV